MKAFIRFIIIVCSISYSYAQQTNYQPIDLAKKLMSNDVDDILNYSTSEFKGHPNGTDLKSNIQLDFLLLHQDNTSAVVNITIKDSIANGFDCYLHMENDPIWKISAFRSLAMTGIIEGAMKEMENMTEAQIDEFINKENSITSRENFDYQLKTMKLSINFDENIIKHFEQNKDEFIALKDKLTQDLDENKGLSDRELNKKYADSFTKLFISSQTDEYSADCNNCFHFLIGGMLDNTVGYMYIPNEKDVPKMSPNYYIMIRKIGDGWYLYKTT